MGPTDGLFRTNAPDTSSGSAGSDTPIGVESDLIKDVRRLKSGDGPDLILWGSSTLTSALLEHGLVDEVVLIVYPVLLGTGKRLFAEGTPARIFELVSTRAFPSGVVLVVYHVAGALR